MFQIIKENVLFFIVFTLFITAGIILLCSTAQGDLIFFFSENRTTFGDLFFKYGTQLGEEIVYAFFFIVCLFFRYRYSILVGLTGGLVSIFSYFLKEFFRHPRPKVYFTELGNINNINTVDGVGLYNAYTSFPSGHTMSAFALYGLLAFLVPKKSIHSLPLRQESHKQPKQYIGLLFILIAIVIGVSRIYLVQHFVKDVVAGALLGVFIAMLLYYVQSMLKIDTNQWFDRSLTFKRQKKVV